MGHFHAENISKRMFLMLYHEHYEHGNDEHGDLSWIGGKKKKPRPITANEFVNYFMIRLESCQKALNLIPDSIWGKKLLTELMENEYSYNASDGSFTHKGYIEDGVNTILNIWMDTQHWGVNVIKERQKNSTKGYILTMDALNKIHNNASNDSIFMFIVKCILKVIITLDPFTG